MTKTKDLIETSMLAVRVAAVAECCMFESPTGYWCDLRQYKVLHCMFMKPPSPAIQESIPSLERMSF